MSAPTAAALWRRRPMGEEPDGELKRTLGPLALVGLGIGCTVGAGLFSLTGIAASENAGPAVTLSFVFAAIACGLSGLCYSELAGMIPRSGSAYSYAYATLGELVAWIIGWDLVLEYAVGASAVAVSWSRYAAKLLREFGLSFPPRLAASPFETVSLPGGAHAAGLANLPAVAIIGCISILLIRGVQESARVNAAVVVVKLAVIALVIGFGAAFIKVANYSPFIPANAGRFGHFGISGILRAAGTLFFAYIGFDAVSTAAQETRNPSRDLPIGILGSLLVCTLCYVAFSLVLTGMLPYGRMLNDPAPVATAIDQTPYRWLKLAVDVGILCGFTSVLLVLLLGQSRVFFSMSGDGLLPAVFARTHPRWRTPWITNLFFGALSAVLCAFLPIAELGHMTSIGTLLAFIITCAGVLVLRRREPDRPRAFRVPFGPTIPVLGILCCFTLMVSLDPLTWLRLAVWMGIGLVVYAGFGIRHSALRRGAGASA